MSTDPVQDHVIKLWEDSELQPRVCGTALALLNNKPGQALHSGLKADCMFRRKAKIVALRKS